MASIFDNEKDEKIDQVETFLITHIYSHFLMYIKIKGLVTHKTSAYVIQPYI